MGAPCAGPLSGMDECPIPPRESIQGLPGAVFVQHSLSLVGVSALAEATSFGEVGMSFTRIEAMTSGFGWKFALGKLFKNPCYQAGWNKNVPFSFS